MNKQTLLILPGWGGNKLTWKDFEHLAKKHFDVVILDLPCFGTEPCPDEVWGVEEYADFVKQKIREEGLDQPILLGHSFGGQVATQLIAHNPNLVSNLILSGAPIFRNKRVFRRFFIRTITKITKTALRFPILEKFERTAKKLYYKATHSPYGLSFGIKRDIFKKVIRQDLAHLLPKIKVPTLIIWGSKDRHVPVRDSKKMKKMINNSKLKIIKKGRHGLHLQQPENLCAVIREFAGKAK